ncbi:hypothetical protein PybrP1_002232 [[Pythium] brassicae (nom. inval.)]|nr:hypothetical protein PybrP1_002232 [[Pythium] brassicae (nom. inval.)]
MTRDHAHPGPMRRTMIKSTVGRVRRSTYDLPDSRNANHAYGLEIVRDAENAGEVVGNFIETNRQALLSGCLTAGDARRFANEHPDILVKPVAKSKPGFVPASDTVYGIKSKESEDINALIQARFTSFSTENTDYPDFSNMKIKGKLPLPRETRASIGKDVRLHSGRHAPPDSDPEHLFKMSKFKKVGSVLCTQPIKSGDGFGSPDDPY